MPCLWCHWREIPFTLIKVLNVSQLIPFYCGIQIKGDFFTFLIGVNKGINLSSMTDHVPDSVNLFFTNPL